MYTDHPADQFKRKHRHHRSSSILQSDIDKTQFYNLYEWGAFFVDSKAPKTECFFNNGSSLPNNYKIELPADANIENVSCGLNHLTIQLDTGDLYGLGANDHGQLGIGEFSWPSQKQEYPVPIKDLMFKGLKVSMVACGFSHTLVATSTYQLFSWGYGKFGALGLGTYESRNSPQQVKFFEQNMPARPQAISCGAHHSAMIDTHGRLYLWGAGEVGQLGSGYRSNECYPVMITKGFANTEFKAVACGNFHTLALTKHGRVVIAGIAYPQTCNEPLFKQIVEVPKSEKIEAKDQCAALTSDGILLIWDEKSQPKAVKIKGAISDFELSKHFVFFRSGDGYYTYSMHQRQIAPVNFTSVDSLNIVAFGSKFVIGLGKSDQPGTMEGTRQLKSATLEVDDNKRSKSSQGVSRELRSCLKSQRESAAYDNRRDAEPYSMRVSYDGQRNQHHIQSHMVEANHSSPLKQDRPDPLPHLSATERKQSNSRTDRVSSKHKLKEALNTEMDKRMALENELTTIKEEFIKLKQGVEVSDVKKIITESQEEYQKLYEICVNECEKQAKLSDQLQRERIVVQSKDDQIRELQHEIDELKQTVKQSEQYKEERVREMCADIEGYQKNILELQKHNERAKETLKIEKERHQTDMSQSQLENRELQKQIETLNQDIEMLRKEKNDLQNEFTAMQDDYLNIKNQQQDFIAKKQLVIKLEREVEQLTDENTQIKSTAAQKNDVIKELENTVQELNLKQQELQKELEEEKLSKKVNKTFSTGKKKQNKSLTRTPANTNKANQSAHKKPESENKLTQLKKQKPKRESSPDKLRDIINHSEEQATQFIADITCMLDPAGACSSAEKAIPPSRNSVGQLQENQSTTLKAYSKSSQKKPPKSSRLNDRSFNGTVNEYIQQRSSLLNQKDEDLEYMQPENPEEAPSPLDVQMTCQETQDQEQLDLNALYDCMTKDAKSLKGCNVGELKNKLETIRSNKLMLESKIKEYEKKLYRT